MKTEYEATFANIKKDEIRSRLKIAGAELLKAETLMRRINFFPPTEKGTQGMWLRVRDESGKITMSVKKNNEDVIENQKEICLTIDDYESGVDFLKTIGCAVKAYQETKREIWSLAGAEICLDEWPFLEPFIEIEASSEEVVKEVSTKLGFNWVDAKFCAVGALYEEKYGIPRHDINRTPRIIFDMENPFVNKK